MTQMIPSAHMGVALDERRVQSILRDHGLCPSLIQVFRAGCSHQITLTEGPDGPRAVCAHDGAIVSIEEGDDYTTYRLSDSTYAVLANRAGTSKCYEVTGVLVWRNADDTGLGCNFADLESAIARTLCYQEA